MKLQPYILASLALLALPAALAAQTPGSINYCLGAPPNSSGNSAVIDVRGSFDLNDNNVIVLGMGLPTRQHAAVLIGRLPVDPMPFGNGDLCLNPLHIKRVSFTTTMMGDISVPLGPQDMALFSPGETWNMQFIFRDDIGQFFGLSDAASVTFAP